MTVMPCKTIGIIGGGQLGRMMCLAAKAMGYRVASLDPEPGCPCAQVADVEITAGYGDMAAIERLARASDVVTYEFENIDGGALDYLERRAILPQGSAALKTSQHRAREKRAILGMGIPVPDFVEIDGGARSLEERAFFPSVLKTATGGYDGKGQAVLRSRADLAAAMEIAESGECVLEKWVPFDMEISAIVARGAGGEVEVFPIAENAHAGGILHATIAPARISQELERRAKSCALKIAEGLGYVGVLAVEMFVAGGDICVNEIAPRPHNSGHYTMDACVTGQFEQHVRAVCGLPLGDPSQHSPAVMVNILGEHMDASDMSRLDRYLPLLKRGKLHLYGKAEARERRKMGHVNMLGDVGESLRAIGESGIWRNARLG